MYPVLNFCLKQLIFFRVAILTLSTFYRITDNTRPLFADSNPPVSTQRELTRPTGDNANRVAFTSRRRIALMTSHVNTI
jgi:hypothetical protein